MTPPPDFTTFMRQYQDMVYATAVRLTGNETHAEDIAQEVFIKAHAHFEQLRASPRAGGWLKTVATNLSINHLQRYRKRWSFFSDLGRRDEAGVEKEADFAAPDTFFSDVDSRERRIWLERGLAELPDHQRVPLVLFHFEEMTYEQIAGQTGVSLSKIKTDILRGREALAKILRRRGPPVGAGGGGGARMKKMTAEEWEDFLSRELRASPAPRAPRTLEARVRAALEERAGRPGHRRSWSDWPVAARGFFWRWASWPRAAFSPGRFGWREPGNRPRWAIGRVRGWWACGRFIIWRRGWGIFSASCRGACLGFGGGAGSRSSWRLMPSSSVSGPSLIARFGAKTRIFLRMKSPQKNLLLSLWVLVGLLAGVTGRADAPGGLSAARPQDQSGSGKAEWVAIGHDVALAEGQKADQVVAVLGSATSAGEVRDQVVAVFGRARVTGGSVGRSVVAVFGDAYINGYVREQVVAVLGDVELGPDAIVDGRIVCVGGEVIRHPGSTAGGATGHMAVGADSQDFGGVAVWFQRCLLKGRLLAFDGSLWWAWMLGLMGLGLYALIAGLAPGGVRRGVETLEVNPSGSLLAVVLAMVLTPLAYLLLVVTIFIGIGWC